jgi:hypothetical protein
VDLPTYTNIWRIEKRLYKLYDFRLPMPLPLGQIAVFTAIAVPYVVVLAVLGVPFSHTLLWLYVLPPGVLAWLATRPVLESKRLPELVASQLRYLTEPRTWCRMAPLTEKDEVAVAARVWRRSALSASAPDADQLEQAGDQDERDENQSESRQPAGPAALRLNGTSGQVVTGGTPRVAAATAVLDGQRTAPGNGSRAQVGPAGLEQVNGTRPGGRHALPPIPQVPAVPPAAQPAAGISPPAGISSPATGVGWTAASAPHPPAAAERPAARAWRPAAPRVQDPGSRIPVARPHGPAQAASPPHGPAQAASPPHGPALSHGTAQSPGMPPAPAQPAGPPRARAQAAGTPRAAAPPPAAPPRTPARTGVWPQVAGWQPTGRPEPTGRSHAPAPAPAAGSPQGPAHAGGPPQTPAQAGGAPQVTAQVRTPAPPQSAVPSQPAMPPQVPDPPRTRPIVTVNEDRSAERPLRMVERALGSPAERRAEGWRDRVVVVPGGHRPGQPDQLQRDRARARLPVAGSRRIVVLGCTVGAGQSVTTLRTGELLASLRDEPVAVLDMNPGRHSLSERARVTPPLTWGMTSAGQETSPPSRLEVITSQAEDVTGADVAPGSQGAVADAGQIFQLLAARYAITLADPAASAVPRVLAVADQLLLVAPASADAASAIAMTMEWLEAHGHANLAAGSITVLNGVSKQTMGHVEQAEAVAVGRCRAIVRVPWDDQLRQLAMRRPPGDAPVSPGHQPAAGPASSTVERAYTALAGVLVASLVAAPELRRAGT